MKRKKTSQIRMGIRTESEHTKTINFIERYVKTHKKFPAKIKIYASIAKDHLKEDPRYYSKLKKAKL